MERNLHDASRSTKAVALFFSLAFLAAVPCAAIYTGELREVLPGFLRLLNSPAKLVTDYFLLGNLPAAFLNAGLCGLAFAALMYVLDADAGITEFAGYFLVVAHCFYGLNLLNMWFPVIGVFVFCKVMKIRTRDNMGMAMFSTAFGPFMSELLHRYPLVEKNPIMILGLSINLEGVFLAMALGLALGFLIPAMLPGAKKLHRGYNLYNGGLAFGLSGLLIYGYMYKTMGVTPPEAAPIENAVYAAHGNSYGLFVNIFFLLVFGLCILNGWLMNGKSFKGYGALWKDDGLRSDFFNEYGEPAVWTNLGIYGLFMLVYFDVVISLTAGAGFTGATVGVTLAAMTFAASGQNPRNVWPILAGFAVLSLWVSIICLLNGREIPWTLSTQGYINGIAFATGLCPFAGVYGKRAGIMAGIICATMCTTTSVMHGGFVLYNGGLTAGITALILLPILDLYMPGKGRI